MEDRQLVLAARKGDTEAFGELVKRYERLVSSIAIAQLSHPSAVEDLVQDSFVAAWMHRDSLKDPSKFRAWLCAITRNLAGKSRRLSDRLVGCDSLDEEPSILPNAEANLLRKESEQALSSALNSIPMEHREVLVLFYREEQSIRDVSDVLGVSEAVAQKRISRARKSVKGQMSAHLRDALSASKVGASVAAAVLATIGAGSGSAAAAASVSQAASSSAAATSIPHPLLQGVLTMKTVIPAAATLALIIGGAVAYSSASDNEPVAADPSIAESENTGSKAVTASSNAKPISDKLAMRPAKASPATPLFRRIDPEERAARFAKFEKSLNFALKPSDAKPKVLNSPPEGKLSDKQIVKQTIAEVKPLLEECYEMARSNDPVMAGDIRMRFKIASEAEIAGLVTEVSFQEGTGSFEEIEPSFEECVNETILSLEFVGMERPMAISYPFRFEPPADEDEDE